MYSLEQSMGIEIKRMESGVLEYDKISDTNKTLVYQIIKEKNLMKINTVRKLKLETIFLIMELIKIKKENNLDYVSIGGESFCDYNRDFQIIKPIETEYGKIYVINEKRVFRLYDLIERINNLQNVWCVRLNSGIEVKTKTHKLSIVCQTFKEEYCLLSVSKKETRYENSDKFEKVEKCVLGKLKKMEIREVFEDVFARESERLLQNMLDIVMTQDTRNQLYRNEHIEELEKTLSVGEETHIEIRRFKTKEYSGSCVVAGDFVFAIAARKQDVNRNEMIIEKIKMNKMTDKVKSGRYDKCKIALEIVLETIKNLEEKGVYEMSNSSI